MFSVLQIYILLPGNKLRLLKKRDPNTEHPVLSLDQADVEHIEDAENNLNFVVSHNTETLDPHSFRLRQNQLQKL